MIHHSGIWSCVVLSLSLPLGGAGAQDEVRIETLASQPCWVIENDTIRVAVTQLGAHMAPVTFCLGSERAIEPYYISPWQDEGLDLDPPVLVPLRGDFFCLPFGGNSAPDQGMQFLPHGEPAGARWTCAGATREGGVTTLTLSLKTEVPPGTITKTIRLVDGHDAVYTQERLEGYDLTTSLGHHAILAVPEKEGSLRIATSPVRFGMTSPVLFSDPANREYQSFAVGARFDSLSAVPLAWKGAAPADCTAFPARTGFADLLAVFSQPAAELPGQVAWTTATNEEGGYLWFSLRDPRMLPATVFWIENHGRHGAPWNGRNRCLGLEDACSYLNEGMPISAEQNDVNALGIPTAVELRPDRPTFVNYVQGVAKIPAGFQMVRTIELGAGEVTFVSATGKRVSVPVDFEFVRSGRFAAEAAPDTVKADLEGEAYGATDPPPPRTQRNATREFEATRRYLHIPIENGAPKRGVTLLAEGDVVVRNDIELAHGEPDWWAAMDISRWRGKTVALQVDLLPEESRGLSAIEQSDTLEGGEDLYSEPLRGQFHFSAQRGWNNDPNGLVFFNGEYHLFFQHNPYGWNWGNMHWGHAVSPDLVHWQEVGEALLPDDLGPMFSGSAVVDWNNTSGLGSAGAPPLVLIYTAAGSPTVQCIASSTDGRTFAKYPGNPVVKEIRPGNRDPKVIWHEPTASWVMVLYVQLDGGAHSVHFLESGNLRDWTVASITEGAPHTHYLYECPDFFELAVDGDPARTQWVLRGANSEYGIGAFDGTSFATEHARLPGHRGRGCYAPQTFSDIPGEDGRRIQIAWFQTETKGMPFNQSMTIPVELRLVATPDGPRLTCTPVKELETLRARSHRFGAMTLLPESPNPLAAVKAELVELRAMFEPGDAAEVAFFVRGAAIAYDAARQELIVNDLRAPAPLCEGRQSLAIFCDRTGLEIFASDGLTYVPMPFIPAAGNLDIGVQVRGGSAHFTTLEVHEIRSAWVPQ